MDTSARRFLGAPPRFGREEGGGGHALRCRLAVGAGQPSTLYLGRTFIRSGSTPSSRASSPSSSIVTAPLGPPA
jgi:hypothetical protein